MDDAELLSRYADDRSEEAFTELVRRYLNLVYSAALRRLGGDTHRAEDVAQAVFAELARRARALASHRAIEGWLYTTTRNMAIQAIRTERRRQAREQAAMIILTEDRVPDMDVERLSPVLDEALERLNDRDREVVLLRFMRGHAFDEIGKRYGISENAARFRVNRALERLRGALVKHGITSTSAAIALVLSEPAKAAPAEAIVNAIATGALSRAAAAPAGVVSHLIPLMSSTKTAASVAIALVCAGGFLIHSTYRDWRDARGNLAFRTAEYHAALDRLDAVTRRSPRGPSQPAATAAPADVAPAPMETARVSAQPVNTRQVVAPAQAAPGDEVNWELSRKPEVRAALAGWIKSVLRSQNAAFYRLANLTPPQISEFEDLCLEFNINMGSAVLTLRPEAKSIPDVEADIHRLLGDANYELMHTYVKTQFVRAVTMGLAGYVYDSDAPLSPEQADQLTTILAESSPKFAAGIPPFPSDIDWESALPRARTILTSAQYDALIGVSAIARNTIAGLNPAMPGTFGDGINPPPAVWRLGSNSP